VIAKRVFDVLFSLLALGLLSPLLLLVALGVKLDSRGPVFFRQVRVGRHGREFRIFKFRTMREDAESSGPPITVGGDPRITGFGAFLRKYKIDEFPQFLNVLAGDMSVVGPRPEVPRYVAHYPADMRTTVLSVRPGVTDLASIEYRDENDLLAGAADPEAVYVKEVMTAKLAHYVRYVRERSFLGDICIVMRSFAAIFSSR
jgi:lipopolysaccharide/colanic/teichoic acid biosynthesis glycosyltransferase